MAQYPVTFETGKHYHVDKSYIWLGPLAVLALIIFWAIVSDINDFIRLIDAAQRGYIDTGMFIFVAALIVVALVIVFGIVFLIYYLSYKNMSFVFDERELSFYSGIFVKKRVHIPYERVQSVNHHTNILQRIVGVCTVVIDSAGGSSNKGVRIPYVRLQVAERIRSDLFVRKAAVSAGAATEYVSEDVLVQSASSSSSGEAPNVLDSTLGPVGDWRGAYGGAVYVEEPVSFEYGLSNGQLALASFTHPGALIAGFIMIICMIFTMVMLFLTEESIAAFLLVFSIPLIIGIAIVVWVMTSIGILLGYGNFRVRRRGSRIEVERGLISRHSSSIDVSRIQSVGMKQSLIRHLMHHCELSLGRIVAQTNDSESKNGGVKELIIHPFLKNSDVEVVLNGLLPEFADRPRQDACRALPRVSLRRAILRRCLWYNWALWGGLICIILLLLAQWGFSTYVLDMPFTASRFEAMIYFDNLIRVFTGIFVAIIIIATVIAAIGSVLWARHSAYCFKGQFLLIHNDGVYTETSLVPRQKIQSGNTKTNPLQRRLQLMTIVATTAAGVRKTDVRLMDIPQTDAVAYLEWLQ